MARFDNEITITPSVLDRLLDDRPDQTSEARGTRQTNLRLLKQAVKRDLEWLLNTRSDANGVPEGLDEVRSSLATFGLPDLSSWNVKHPEEQQGLRRALEDVVRRFEPRLEGVEVTLDTVSETDRSVRFRIDARLRVEPTPEPVTIDSMLQLGNGEFVVKGD
jgi:type VI secretion system protein ImpF